MGQKLYLTIFRLDRREFPGVAVSAYLLYIGAPMAPVAITMSKVAAYIHKIGNLLSNQISLVVNAMAAYYFRTMWGGALLSMDRVIHYKRSSIRFHQ